MTTENPGRRELLLKIFPSCALLCVGCKSGPAPQESGEAAPAKHKFQEQSDMTYEQVFRFAFAEGSIPVLKNLADEIGKEKFDALLRRAASKAGAEQTKRNFQDVANRDLAAFLVPLKSASPLLQHAVSYEFVEDTEKAAELRVTECLWAKVFREMDAAEIGYAAICHPDFAIASAFNPKLKMIRTKTLMQGHDCCNHRWVMGA